MCVMNGDNFVLLSDISIENARIMEVKLDMLFGAILSSF